MKYFFISDIHGEFDRMAEALRDAGFNPSKDTIVSLGDPFDRGDKSYEVLQFLMSCPNRILVWGNHDMRLKKLITGREHIASNDYHNGVLQTLQSLCKNTHITIIDLGITLLKTDSDNEMRYRLLWKYFSECVWAVEFDNLIATHGWLPVQYDLNAGIYNYSVLENWREADADLWYNASWAKTVDMVKSKAFADKKLIVGHWHAWRLRYRSAAKVPDKFDFSTYEEDNFIAIDGCTGAAEGVVNVYVYETDAKPIVYNPRY